MHLAIALLVALPARAAHDPQDILALAHEELRSIDALIDDARSRAVQRELHQKVAHLDALLAELAAAPQQVSLTTGDEGGRVSIHAGPSGLNIDISGTTVDDDDPVPIAAAPPPPKVTREPCSAADLAQIQAALNAESFADGRLKVLGSAASNHWFTVAQVRTLMGLFDFDSDKVEAAAMLYPRVIDTANWYQVYSELSFEADKDALRERVGE